MGQPYQTDPLHNLKKILRFLLLFFALLQYKTIFEILFSSPHLALRRAPDLTVSYPNFYIPSFCVIFAEIFTHELARIPG